MDFMLNPLYCHEKGRGYSSYGKCFKYFTLNKCFDIFIRDLSITET